MEREKKPERLGNVWLNTYDKVITFLVNSKFSMVVFVFLSVYFLIIAPNEHINRTLFLMLSMLSFFGFNKYKESKRIGSSVLESLLTLYIAFSIFGFHTIFFSRNSYERLTDIVIFILGVLWTVYFVQALLYFVGMLSEKWSATNSIQERASYWRKWVLFLFCSLPAFLLFQFAFNPAITTPDSLVGLGHIIGEPLFNHHPPLHTLAVAFIMQLTGGDVRFVVWAQILAFSSILATCLCYLGKLGVQKKKLIISAILIPLIPSIGLHGTTVWKDIPFAIAMLWLTYICVRIYKELYNSNEKASSRMILSISIQLCISLVLVFFLRANGFMAYIFTFVMLFLVFIAIKRKRMILSLIFSLVIIVLIQFPFYNHMNVVESGFSGEARYYALLLDLQAVYYDGGTLSENSLFLLRRSIPEIDSVDVRENFQRDWVHWNDYDLSEMEMGEFLFMYADTFVRNPFLVSRSVLTRTRAYWKIGVGEQINTINWVPLITYRQGDAALVAYRQGDAENPLINAERTPNFMTNFMQHQYLPFMHGPLTGVFVWRFGIWVLLMNVFIVYKLIKKDYRILMIFVPIYSYLLSILLANGWTDYRYGLSVFMIALFVLPFLMISGRSLIHKKSDDLHLNRIKESVN